MARYYANPATRPKLDPAFYSLQPEELEFFQTLTGILDEDALKEHILSVQAKAYELYGYPCIRRFTFTRLKIARLPAYPQALKLLQERKDPILLDIGCCFGNDARKAVLDGWPVQNVIASDLRQGFWGYGHELFKSTPETFPAAFIAGDVFDTTMLSLSTSDTDPDTPLPPLRTLTSLTALISRISAIHASAFFHLFSEDQQLALAKRLIALLLPLPGSIIFGQHGAKPVKGFRTDRPTTKNGGASMFCHSPESWREMWVEGVKGLGIKVEVEAELKESKRLDIVDHTEATEQDKFWVMNWSVHVV